jgi:signal transduction histidine kinase
MAVWSAVLSSVVASGFAGWVATLPSPVDSMASFALAQLVFAVRGGAAWVITGAGLLAVRPRNVLGWLILGVGWCWTWSQGLLAYAKYSALHPWQVWVGATLAHAVGVALAVVASAVPATLLLAFYPDGRLPGRRWRWLVAGAATAVLLDSVLFGWVVWTHHLLLSLQWWDAFLLVPWTFAIGAGTVIRLVRARPPQRQQLAWLVCAVMPLSAAGAAMPWLNLGSALLGFYLLVGLPVFLVPVAVAVGVLRYRLLGIETVLRRGLVYATLTVLVFTMYLAVSALASRVLEGGPLPGVVAAAVVAIGLSPARDRLQRAADRLIYGERRDPLRAVTRLGQRVATTVELDLLPAALTSITDAVRAPGADITAPDGRILGAIGASVQAEPMLNMAVPLEYGGRRVGTLRVACPRAGEVYTGAEARLLSALAPQVAVIVRAIELTEALQAERDRVLTATTTERDRLRRDLHDGLGPSLSGRQPGPPSPQRHPSHSGQDRQHRRGAARSDPGRSHHRGRRGPPDHRRPPPGRARRTQPRRRGAPSRRITVRPGHRRGLRGRHPGATTERGERGLPHRHRGAHQCRQTRQRPPRTGSHDHSGRVPPAHHHRRR